MKKIIIALVALSLVACQEQTTSYQQIEVIQADCHEEVVLPAGVTIIGVLGVSGADVYGTDVTETQNGVKVPYCDEQVRITYVM